MVAAVPSPRPTFSCAAAPDTLRVHSDFHIRIPGDRIAYTYIRKNACTVFKRMILHTSLHKDEMPDRARHPSKFMGKYHRISTARMALMKTRVVVLREPISRVLSAYINKFLVCTDGSNKELMAQLGECFSMPLGKLTFERFVHEYLCIGEMSVNNHFYSQYRHLSLAGYSHVLDQRHLAEDARTFMHPQFAGRWFDRRVNSTSNLPARDIEGAYRMSRDEIFGTFEERQYVPTKQSFLSDDLKAALTARYNRDIELWTSFCAARELGGGLPPALEVTPAD